MQPRCLPAGAALTACSRPAAAALQAASLGVPRGPQYGKLVRGEEVTAANGQVVRPADVMEPATPGPVVLVVDCPSAAFLPALTAAPLLQECATGAKRDKGEPPAGSTCGAAELQGCSPGCGGTAGWR